MFCLLQHAFLLWLCWYLMCKQNIRVSRTCCDHDKKLMRRSKTSKLLSGMQSFLSEMCSRVATNSQQVHDTLVYWNIALRITWKNFLCSICLYGRKLMRHSIKQLKRSGQLRLMCCSCHIDVILVHWLQCKGSTYCRNLWSTLSSTISHFVVEICV